MWRKHNRLHLLECRTSYRPFHWLKQKSPPVKMKWNRTKGSNVVNNGYQWNYCRLNASVGHRYVRWTRVPMQLNALPVNQAVVIRSRMLFRRFENGLHLSRGIECMILLLSLVLNHFCLLQRNFSTFPPENCQPMSQSIRSLIISYITYRYIFA